MASIIIQISKKTPEEELFEVVQSVSEEFKKQFAEFGSIDKEKLLQETVKNLPALLRSEQEVRERFTLVGHVFVVELEKIVEGLEAAELHLGAMQALSVLYTITGNGYVRFRIFKAITALAGKDGALLTLIQPHLLKIEKFVASWDSVPITELSEFIQSLLSFKISDQKRAALIFRLLSHGGLEGEAADHAISKLFQTTSEFEVSDLTTLPGFHKAGDVVQRLVELVSGSSVHELSEYWQKHAQVLENRGFSHGKVIEAGRVTGIVKLANGSLKVTFREVANRLDVSEDDVDYWVVRAISGGLVKGKIDTIGKVISFEHSRVLATKKSALEMLNRLEDALTS